LGGFIVKFYKFVVCFFIVLFVLSFDFHVFADDLDFENDTDISNFVQSSSSIVTKPVINSGAGIVFDRNSGCILFGKNENEKRKMASVV
jgi:D-alanyl-D-alanine carboxypeptidase